MNQLTTTNQTHPLLQPNALQVAKQEIFNAVNASIAKCYVHLNFKIPEDTEYLVNEVTDAIIEKYPSMRTAEIPTAFAKGIRNEYGEFFGLCVVSFEQFIVGYLASPERKRLVDEKNRLQIEASSEPSPDEKFSTAKGLSLDVYNLVKANHQVGIKGVAVYVFLNALGLIHADYKKGIMKEALNTLVAEKERDIANSTELIRRRQMNADLEILKTNIANDILTVSQYDDVKRVAKRQVLTNWFRDLILDDSDLAELIESKRNFYLSSHNKEKA